MFQVGRKTFVMQRSKRSILGRNWSVWCVSDPSSPEAGWSSRNSPRSSEADSSGLAWASHGYAAVIVGGSCGRPDAKSFENRSGAGDAGVGGANGGFALMAGGAEQSARPAKRVRLGGVACSVRSKSEMND